MTNNLDNIAIYEIFRACRLCGAGGGYKMPIIPSAIGFDCADIELQQKIRECVQIEVHQEDKMPPLVCELCVDKVNDFYEFLEMCRQTNQRTRQQLGLPMPVSQAASEEDCILGVTEPVYVQMSDDEHVTQKIVRPVKVRDDKKIEKNDNRVKTLKKELECLISLQETPSVKQPRVTNRDSRESSTSNSSKRSSKVKEDVSTSRLKEQKKNERSKPHLKREKEKPSTTDTRDSEDSEGSISRRKKARIEKSSLESKIETPKPESKVQRLMRPEPRSQNLKLKKETRIEKSPRIEEKIIKLKIKYKDSPPLSPVPKSRPGPRSAQAAASPPPQPLKSVQSGTKPKEIIRTGSRKSKPGPACWRRGAVDAEQSRRCGVCALKCVSQQGLASHLRSHTVRPTQPLLACNPCGEWFSSPEETTAHHKWHKHAHVMYACRACDSQFRHSEDYDQHMAESGAEHVPWREVASWRGFSTRPLLPRQKCGGVDARPGGKCSKCDKYCHTQKSLKRHEALCADKIKVTETPLSDLRVPAGVRRPLLVRVARCDSLLRGRRPPRTANVANVPPDFGLDPRSVYPYRSLVRVKREPLRVDGMVSIHKEIRDELYKEEEYVHWDSDNSSDSDSEFSLVNEHKRHSRVPSLTALALKTIFSRRCLGKVPRKLRKVKQDKFDSLFSTETEFDNAKSDINSIINNLGVDENASFEQAVANNKIVSSDAFSEPEAIEGVTNYDSDTLINNLSVDKRLEENDSDIKSTDSFNETDAVTNSVGNLDVGNVTDASISDAETRTHGDVLKDNFDDNIINDTIASLLESGQENLNAEDKNGISEDNQVFDNNITEKVNYGDCDVDKVNGTTNSNDLISEINELYDKKLMDELDAQIGI